MDSQTVQRMAALEAENELMDLEYNEDEDTHEKEHDFSVNEPVQSTHTQRPTSSTHTPRASRASRAPRAPQAPRAKRPKPVRKKSSKCWLHFTSVGVESDGKERAKCHYCGIKLVIDRTHGTSTMNRHARLCPEKPETEVVAYDHKVDKEMVSEIIIYHDLPFRYVEFEKVRERDKYLNPECEPMCRQTASKEVYKRYEIERLKLKEVFASYQGRMSFTSDLWTSRSQVRGYICLTAHYIDAKWNLHSHILAFCDIKPPHTGEAIAKKIFDILKDWGLERRVFSLTLDNASANDNMQKILTHRLQSGNGLLCDGRFLHVRCCAHILNLIVKKGLEVGSSLLVNIRESVKYVKASDSRKDSFAACVDSAGIESNTAGLSLDVDTRWNSTYEMLVRALKFRKAFENLQLYDRNYKCLPSKEEWDRGEKIQAFLKPFSTLTTYFSGVKYPTASVYFLLVWKIELLLKRYARCKDNEMRLMAVEMQKKFAKYWDEYSLVLAMAAVLDPRIKLQMLKEAYNKLDPITAEKKVEIVKKNLELLYKEYSSKSSGSSSRFPRKTPDELLTESPLDDDLDDDLLELERNVQFGSNNERTNLDMYLADSKVDISAFSDLEVLDYWKDNQHRYGDLALLARDILSIPITTVASESAFSVGGRVLNLFRNRLLPKTVQALICTRNWLRGFAEFEGDIEEYFDYDDEDASKKASTSGGTEDSRM